MKLVLIRHGESEWNRLNLFTGWTDVDLSERGHEEAKAAGRLLKQEGLDLDICYTSYLKRVVHTLDHILGEMDRTWLPIVRSWKLNERHYGALQGLNKAETAEEYGEEQVREWRRSYDILLPVLNQDDMRSTVAQGMYQDVNPSGLPSSESLETMVARVVPYFNKVIKEGMMASKRVIIAAHGNSLRALAKYFGKLSEEDIVNVNIPTGVPLVYKFDVQGSPSHHRYLGDPRLLKQKAEAVTNQGEKAIGV